MDGVNPSIDWEFVTEPVSGVNDKSIHIARGKCLGGSSARNYLVYNRPSAGTMQEWADRVGDSSWEWEKVLPFYKNSSTITPADMSLRSKEQEPMLDPAAFGNGPVQVRCVKLSLAKLLKSSCSRILAIHSMLDPWLLPSLELSKRWVSHDERRACRAANF